MEYKNIYNLNSIFENCSLLTFIPNISNWKFNYEIKINNIFKGCDSLLIIPDISKWKANISDLLKNISHKIESQLELESNSSDLSKDYPPFQGSNAFSSSENNYNDNSINNSGNEELDDYYDNFYK